MILGALFFAALVVSTVLVGLNRALEGLLIECHSCGRDRFRRGYCSKCGVIGNPDPEPMIPRKKNLETHHERQVRFE